ncbi:MAG: hypothetical protein HYV07_15620 [Deltaproteobacteria bacterium]|nr:hypothetical protein [Deltaproteobacteria bacterium]
MRALCLTWVALTACTDRLVHLEPPAEGERVFVARISHGAPVELHEYGDASSLALIEGEEVVRITLRKNAFVLPDGVTLAADWTARLVDAPRGDEGTCARCLVPWVDEPGLLFEGDSCSLPPSAVITPYTADDVELKAAAIDVAALRASIRIERPGKCACAAPQARPEPRPFELEPLAPDEPYVFSALASSPDGAVLGFGSGRVLLIRPDGSRLEAIEPLARGAAFAVFAGTSSSGAFAIARPPNDRHDETALFVARVVGDELVVRSIGSTRVLVDFLVRGPGETFVVVGGASMVASSARASAFTSCDLEGRCDERVFGMPCARGSVAAIDPARGLAMNSDHMIVQVNGAWDCGSELPFALDAPEGLVTIESFERAWFGESRVNVCATARLGSSRGAALVDLALDGTDARAFRFAPGAGCDSVLPLPGRNRALVIFSDLAASIVSDGVIEATFRSIGRGRTPSFLPELGREANRVLGADGGLFISTYDGAWYRAVEGRPVERIYGPATPASTAVTAVRADGTLVGLADRRLWTTIGDGFEASSLGVDAVAVSSSFQSKAWVVSRDTESSFAPERLDVDAKALIRVAETRPLVAIAELSEGTAIAIDAEHRLVAVFDDATIVELDGSSAYNWASSSMGVGWAGGEGVLARAVLGPVGLRVDASMLDRIEDRRPWSQDPVSSPPSFRAGRAECPDAVTVGIFQDYGKEDVRKDLRGHRALVALSSAPCADVEDGFGALCANAVERTWGRPPRALVGPFDSLDDGCLRDAAGDVHASEIGVIESAASSGDHWLAGGRAARLARLRFH